MAFEPGSVVALKSGGQPMTVVETGEDGVKCVWLGEEGDFFSATIPAVALEDWDASSADEDDDEEDAETTRDNEAANLETVPMPAERREDAA
jgi:uncharacterized protein YodC (DUF2158 family)